MKINPRAGLLVILLAVPAFLFLFLFFFGENKFDLPYKFPVAIKEGDANKLIVQDSTDLKDFLSENSERSSPQNDTLYLTFDGSVEEWKLPEIRIIYDCLSPAGPGDNQKSELKRIEEKITNLGGIKLLNVYEIGKNEDYFTGFYKYLELNNPEKFQPSGMIFLIDRNNFFRGYYDPQLKSEVDRLITEYQILLDN